MYKYEDLRPKLFTEDGSRTFTAIRDAARGMLRSAGAFRLLECMNRAQSGGDSWLQLACFDRMVELGELRRLTDSERTPAQHEVFVAGPVWSRP